MGYLFYLCPPSRSDGKKFWQLVINQARNNRYPWMCVGDFNQVGSMWEKQGGLACNRSQIEGFQFMILECALMDLEFKGTAYT